MGAHHDPLADEADLLTRTEALIRIEDEIRQLRRQLEDVEHDLDSAAAEHGRRRLATLEDAAERYRLLLTPGRNHQTAAPAPS